MLIELENVTKTYRSRRGHTRAVDDLTMAIPAGGVHGFLGPNGSGKTTTIRILLGLIRPNSGSVRVMGADVPGDLASVTGSIGALVETPQLFPSFSGRRNLQILAKLGDIGDSRVEELLDTVGLRERGDDRVKGYSLGMRQRLAIAAAMLKDPTLLILDEPTNGLDPAGMVEVRELVRRLGSDGRTTVFLSSHLLAEIEAVCDAVTILRRGRLVTSGSVAEVLARAGSGERLAITMDADPAAALDVLAAQGFAASILGPHTLLVESSDGARVNWVLGSAGIWARAIAEQRPDLEQAFLNLTEEPSPTEGHSLAEEHSQP